MFCIQVLCRISLEGVVHDCLLEKFGIRPRLYGRQKAEAGLKEIGEKADYMIENALIRSNITILKQLHSLIK